MTEVRVFTLQDDFKNPQEPTPQMTANVYGIIDFDVQYWDVGTSAWMTVSGGSIAGNDRVMRIITFPAVTTTKFRILVTAARNRFSRIIEVEAYNCAQSSSIDRNTSLAPFQLSTKSLPKRF